MADKLTFMKKWFEAEMNDEYNDTTEQEMAYILYAAAKYAFYEEKINMGEVFGNEFKSLNRAMPNIYSQMENIKEYGDSNGKKNQKYDNEAVKELAAAGFTQKEICEKLGYDISKSKSLSSNRGYKEGAAIYKERISQNGKENDSSSKNCQNEQKLSKTINATVDSFQF